MPAAIAVTYRFDRLAGSFRPFRRHAITLSPYCQRRCAVARPIPNCQQIALPSLAHANLMAACQQNNLSNFRMLLESIDGR
jgi:hypothetical protein